MSSSLIKHRKIHESSEYRKVLMNLIGDDDYSHY